MPAGSDERQRPGPPGGLAPGAARELDPWSTMPTLPIPGHTLVTGNDVQRWLRSPASHDLPRIAAMWERCSPATRTARFHAPVRDMPASYLETVLSDPPASLVAVPAHTGEAAALASLIPRPRQLRRTWRAGGRRLATPRHRPPSGRTPG